MSHYNTFFSFDNNCDWLMYKFALKIFGICLYATRSKFVLGQINSELWMNQLGRIGKQSYRSFLFCGLSITIFDQVVIITCNFEAVNGSITFLMSLASSLICLPTRPRWKTNECGFFSSGSCNFVWRFAALAFLAALPCHLMNSQKC